MSEKPPATTPSNRRIANKNALIYFGASILILAIIVSQYRWGVANNWTQAYIRAMRSWLPLVVLFPFIWFLVQKFPLSRGSKLRNYFLHGAASIILVVIAESMVAFIIQPATAPMADNLRDRGPNNARRGPPARRTQARVGRLNTGMLTRKAQAWIPLYWGIVFFANSIRLRREAEERKQLALELERDLVTAQLQSLQNRLQPHFLFNALNSISTLIHIDPNKADEMVERLSNLLRQVLESGDKQLIPLQQELELLRNYLAVELVRFPDRLSINENIDDAVLDFPVPPLILQPIVENAVKHGIEPKAEPSLITIAIAKNEAAIQIVIEDDGIGFAESTGGGSGSRVGLSSLESRLSALYSDNASFSIASPDEGGTRVTIYLPEKSFNRPLE